MVSEARHFLLGSQPFGPLDIMCRKPTLIPRPETEFLTEHTASLIIQACKSRKLDDTVTTGLRILDLCTGSGCIALLLHHRLQEALIQAEITAVDKSKASLDLARQNVKVQNATQVTIKELDLFDDDDISSLSLERGPFDVIVSNPPYIPKAEWEALDETVRGWEDSEALIGDVDEERDGLAFYRRIAIMASQSTLLSDRYEGVPSMVVEVGHSQAKQVQDIFAASGSLSRTAIWDDPWSIARGVFAWK